MSSSGNFDTIFFQKAFPLSTITSGYPPLTMLAVGPTGYLKDYSFYNYQSSCGFKDTSTITSYLSSYIDKSISTTNVTINSNVSTIYNTISTVNSNIVYNGKTYVYTLPFANNFISTYDGTYPQGPIGIKTSNLFLANTPLKTLMDSGKYTIMVNLQYSIYVSTTSLQIPSYTWISTIGMFNMVGTNGASFTTRLGNNEYSHINTSLIFNPISVTRDYIQIAANNNNFHLELWLSNSGSTIPTATVPYFDIFMQAENNVTFTCIPITGTT